MPKLSTQFDLPRCPHCSIDKPHLRRSTGNFSTATHLGMNTRYWSVFSCANCGGAVLACSPQEGGDATDWFPKGRDIDPAIPSPASDYLTQAAESVHAPAGSIMLAASAVDAMLKHHGYKGDSLHARIERAAKKHLITDGMAKWAHLVRLDANAERHADEKKRLATTEDAERTLEFALALGEFLFVLPERVTKGLDRGLSGSAENHP